MAAGDRSQAEELWSKWEQMTALVPQEERAPVEAWIRREREVFPAGMRWKDAGPVEWLEELVLDEGCGLKKMAGRMLYAAWRLGEGCMQGERHRRAYLHRHVSTEDRLRLCRRIGYSVEEIMEDSVLACQDGGSRSAVHTFGVIMEKLYVKYPYEQLTAYLDGRYAGGSLPEAGTEEDRWRLWADGELLHMFLKAHDPRSDIYMEGFLACLQKLPVINMEELPLRLALGSGAAREFLMTRPFRELEDMGYHSGWIRNPAYDELVDHVIRARREEAVRELSCITGARELVRWMKVLYERAGILEYAPLPGLLGHRSKAVRTLAEKILNRHLEEAYPVLQMALPGLQGEAAQLAEQMLHTWEEDRSAEKGGMLFGSREELERFCGQRLLPAMKKKSEWIPKEWLLQVRYADGSGRAPEAVLQYVFARCLSLTEPERLETVDRITGFLDQEDLRRVMDQSWQFWLLEDCNPGHRLLLVLCGSYGSDALMLQMAKGAEALARQKRGEMAEYVVRAMGMNRGDTALMLLEQLACQEGQRKPRMSFARVEHAAGACFQAEADRRGMCWDALADQVVSDLGFDRKGRQKLCMGSRTLTVHLMPDLTLRVEDEQGKWLKNLPKPRKGEDPGPAEAARKQYADWKKQVEAVHDAQIKRLERVMRTGRCWQKEAWERLFLKHPVVRSFTGSLIWGIYRDGMLTDTFRCLEDGTLCTAGEEAYQLEITETEGISLVSPAELSGEERRQWRQHLADYELDPLLGQLDAPAVLTEEQMDPEGAILRWEGQESSTSRLLAFQTRYGAVQKDGGYCFLERGSGGILVEAEEIPWDYYGPVKLEKAVFLDAGGERCTPDALPLRFVSSVVRLVDRCLINYNE